MQRILIIGATSAIASACARRWSAQGATFFLVGRDPEKLAAVAADLEVRGAAAVQVYTLDLLQLEGHAAMLEACCEQLGTIDIALLCHGTLPDQAACEQDASLAAREIDTNGSSAIALLIALANIFQTQGNGQLAVISSVAGERGRPSNYVYGAAKAALSTFCDGLRVRLHRSGVQLLLVKPGFVDTPMTAGLDLPGALTASPARVARDIDRALARGRSTLYTPWFWAPVMWLIRAMPQAIFNRLSL